MYNNIQEVHTDINQKFANNSSRLINEPKLRQVLNDMADFLYENTTAEEPIEKTYAQFLADVEDSKLLPGKWYKVTDYATSHKILEILSDGTIQNTGVDNVGPVEPLLVLANSTSNYIRDQVYSTVNGHQLYWDVVGNINGMPAGPISRGVIRRRMIPHYGISLPYDFQIVQWKIGPKNYFAFNGDFDDPDNQNLLEERLSGAFNVHIQSSLYDQFRPIVFRGPVGPQNVNIGVLDALVSWKMANVDISYIRCINANIVISDVAGITLTVFTDITNTTYADELIRIYANAPVNIQNQSQIPVWSGAIVFNHDPAVSHVSGVKINNNQLILIPDNIILSVSATERSAWNNKVDKVAGFGLSSNDFTTAEKQKLAGLESSKYKGSYPSLAALNAANVGGVGNFADVDGGPGQPTVRYIWDVSDNAWVPQQGESTAETPASIKTKYETNPDTNAFTDNEKTKLAGLQNYNDASVQAQLAALASGKADASNVYTKGQIDTMLGPFATKTGIETLTNKTLSDPKITLPGTNAIGDMYYRKSDGTLQRIPAALNEEDILKWRDGKPQWGSSIVIPLIVDAGSDQNINLPTSTVQLAASIITGVANTWTWTRTSGPANYGINIEAGTYTPPPGRTFTITPDVNGRALITQGTYTGGDVIQLSGVFKSVNFQGLKGTGASTNQRIYITNVPGQLLKIGDTTWVTGQPYAEALKFDIECKYLTFWGRHINHMKIEGPTGGEAIQAYKNIDCTGLSDNIRLSYIDVKNGGTGIDCKKTITVGDPNSYGDTRRIANMKIDNVIIDNTYNEGMYLGNTTTYYNIITGAQAPTFAPGVVPDPATYQKPVALQDLVVENCTIKNTGADGLQIARTIGVQCYKNWIENPGTRGFGNNDSHCAGLIMGGWVTNWHINNCYIKNGGGDAIQIFGAAGLIENTLVDTCFYNCIYTKQDTAGQTTVNNVTVVNPGSQCVRVNGERIASGWQPLLLQRSILVAVGANKRIYLENNGAVTEPAAPNNNTKVDAIQDAQLNPNNWFLPATDPRGFRKTGDIGLSGSLGAVIVTPNAQSTLVQDLIEGTHVFEVEATGDTSTATDTVQITVAASQAQAPVANAGIDQTIQLPDNDIALNASGSTAPGSSITGYVWSKISGPSSFNITTPNAVTTTVTALVEGTYVFQVLVTNALGLTSTDTITITVQAASASSPAKWEAKNNWASFVGDPSTQYTMVYQCENYDPLRPQGYPCFIDLHGQGEIGSGLGVNGIDKVKLKGAGYYYENGDRPPNILNFVPQLPSSPGTWEFYVIVALRTWILANYNVDPTKMYIGGFSLGDKGACLAMREHPEWWAAVYGAAGDTADINTVSNQNAVVGGVRVADVPYRHVVGSQDTGATNGFKVLDAQGQLATAPRYTAMVEFFYGYGHVDFIWNDQLYNRQFKTNSSGVVIGGTAYWDRIEWCLRFRVNDPEFGATSHVAVAESTNDLRDYYMAAKLVNDLASSSTKTALLARLATVKGIIKGVGRWFQVDLGTGTVVANWNKAAFTGSTGTMNNIVDIDGTPSDIDFTMPFQQWTPPNIVVGYNLSWLGLPKEVLGDGFRIYNGSSSQTAPSVQTFAGLNNAAVYDLYPIYNLRKNPESQNTGQRSTLRVTINGVDRDFDNAMQNTSKFPKITGIAPTAGVITLNLKAILTPGQNFQVELLGWVIQERL